MREIGFETPARSYLNIVEYKYFLLLLYCNNRIVVI